MCHRNGGTSTWSAVYSSPSSVNSQSRCSPMVSCFFQRLCTPSSDKKLELQPSKMLTVFCLQPLPNFSLPPADKYAEFIEANRTEDPVERLKVIKRLVSLLDNLFHPFFVLYCILYSPLFVIEKYLFVKHLGFCILTTCSHYVLVSF